MPKYNFVCDKCEETTDFSWSMKNYDENIKTAKCSHCKSQEIRRDYENCELIVMVKDVKTIGQLADKNTKKYKSRIEEQQAIKKEAEDKKKSWHHKCGSATHKDIQKMNRKQKHEYITKGTT